MRLCATPRCRQLPGHGRRGLFCSDCAERLAQMGRELKVDGQLRRSPDGTIKKRRPKRPTCCRPGCYEPRVPPNAFCDACLTSGYVETAED